MATATTPGYSGDTAPAPRRRIGRRIAIGLYGLLCAVVALALVAAALVGAAVAASFPQTGGMLDVPGLEAPVDVLRDDLGIPTIVADTTDDLFHAQGYVHAQDRFWEMDFRRHVTSGRLSELFGESQLETDTFLRTLGWRQVAQAEVEALDDTVRSYYEAYADGVNAYLAEHSGAAVSLEYAVLGLQNPGYEIEPWTPSDSVAWLKAMAYDLIDNLGDESERAELGTTYDGAELAELYPQYPFDEHPVIVPEIRVPAAPAAPEEPEEPAGGAAAIPASSRADAPTVTWSERPDVVAAVATLLGGGGEGLGSNSWVVSGELTASGLPLLANDPHLGANLPSVWYQSHLRCRAVTDACEFDVAGFGFSGVPGVIIGHNDTIAWGFTNLTTDVADLYLERVDGDDYWRDGQLVPLETRTETIEVAGGDPVEVTVRSTAHGPIVSDASESYAAIADDPVVGNYGTAGPPPDPPPGETAVSLRWTALDAGTTASSIFALDLARDFAAFRTAAGLFAVPAQNLVYADVDGNIGYQTPGRLPIRGAGDGWLPQPGWDSRYDWTGFIPFGDLPVSYNPPEGLIVTANNAVAGPEYPYALTNDWDYGWRAARITDLVQSSAAAGPLTVDDLVAIQADQEFHLGKRLTVALGGIDPPDEATAAALALLDDWDAQSTADSAAAAYANAVWNELVLDLFARRDDPAPTTHQGRLFLVVDRLLDDPDSPWWTNEGLGVSGRDEMLAVAAAQAAERMADLQGDPPAAWRWGRMHALSLESSTFGASGIAPIEWLFNRGPYEVGGGASVVDATGWNIGSSFETVTVPSMRMVVDLSDLDGSEWQNLTGQSGHAFDEHYVDQTDAWQRIDLYPWPFSLDAVEAATTDRLTLTPAG